MIGAGATPSKLENLYEPLKCTKRRFDMPGRALMPKISSYVRLSSWGRSRLAKVQLPLVGFAGRVKILIF
jgi:hypothetical protein